MTLPPMAMGAGHVDEAAVRLVHVHQLPRHVYATRARVVAEEVVVVVLRVRPGPRDVPVNALRARTVLGWPRRSKLAHAFR
jgi:hypothetical protein